MIPWYAKLAASSLLLALVVYALKPLWLALVLTGLLYLLLQPAAARLQASGLPKTRAIFMALALPVLLLGLGISNLLVTLRGYLPELGGDLLLLQQSVGNALRVIETRLHDLLGLQLNLSRRLAEMDFGAMANTDQLLASTGLVANVALNLTLVPILAFFMLRDFRLLRDRLLALLPNAQFELGWLMYHRVSVRMQAYLRGLFLQQLILAVVSGTGFWLAGFPSPYLLGLLTGIAGLVPYLGPVLALLAPTLVLLSEAAFNLDGLLHAVIVIAVSFGIDNLLVMPLLVASSVNLHPAVAIAAVIVAGHLGGIPAMVIAIPVLGMARIVVESIYRGLQPVQLGSDQR